MAVNITPIHTSGKHRLLVIDPSASHLAWCLLDIDYDRKTASFNSVGMLWTHTKWSRGQRFKYMLRSLDWLINAQECPVTGCITEAFFANPRLMFGSSVIPTVNAFMEMSAATRDIGYLEIGPPAWRSILQIKPVRDSKGKRDFKKPTRDLVEMVLDKLPEKIPSNINQKARQTPSDIADCLAIGIAYCKYVGITKIKLGSSAFNPVFYLNQLGIISTTI